MSRLTDAQIAAQIRAKTTAMQTALVNTRITEPDAQAGNLMGLAAAWQAGRAYEQGELFTYDGMLGFTRQALTASEVYPPFSAGTEALYGVRPPADPDGVYPYVYNMRAEPGMLVREKGDVYLCVSAAPVDPVLYSPSQTPALFEKEDF